jgi:hypothetical protein
MKPKWPKWILGLIEAELERAVEEVAERHGLCWNDGATLEARIIDDGPRGAWIDVRAYLLPIPTPSEKPRKKAGKKSAARS